MQHEVPIIAHFHYFCAYKYKNYVYRNLSTKNIYTYILYIIIYKYTNMHLTISKFLFLLYY